MDKSLIVVTGGAGFIGSNLVEGLNEKGITNILIVDDLTDGIKFKNLIGLEFLDYLDKDEFIYMIKKRSKYSCIEKIKTIFHQGACSSTTEWNGKYMMANNFEYSKQLLNYSLAKKIQFIYASSAAVYGGSSSFSETPHNEIPLNVYGFSKWQFDQYVRATIKTNNSQVIGLRYFNVYGPREEHKGSMASVAFHLNNQILSGSNPQLFAGNDGYADGEQIRDFVYVKDVIDQNIWCYYHPHISGIFNAGTGNAQSFNEVAQTVQHYHFEKNGTNTTIEYIPFPEKLKNHYQSYTKADMSSIIEQGYNPKATSVQHGVYEYMEKINS